MGRLIRAEWTKLRSLRSTVWLMAILVALAVPLSVLAASRNKTSGGTGPGYVDQFHFVHRPLTGDGSVTVRVAAQQDSHEWATAGVMLKHGTDSGSSYVALMVTPRHGVRLHADFGPSVRGTANTAPRWLRLTRSGSSVTGSESADGATWTAVGTVDLGTLPTTVEAGLFVASPPTVVTVRDGNNTSTGPAPTLGTATFDQVSVVPVVAGQQAAWRHEDVGSGAPDQAPGHTTEAGGTFTVTGSGEIAGVQPVGDTDVVKVSLTGVEVAVLAIVVFGVLFATSEYRRGVIRTTFTACPRRGRVLVAKAVVVAAAAFAGGLLAAAAAFLLTQPTLHRNGFTPPLYPYPSLLDARVARAIAGTALFLAVIAVFSLGVGVILRRAAGAVTVVGALIVVPPVVASSLSEHGARWINRLTPAAGLAIQQTRDRPEYWNGPWTGLGVACAYAAVTLTVAYLLLRRRDA